MGIRRTEEFRNDANHDYHTRHNLKGNTFKQVIVFEGKQHHSNISP